MSKRRGILSAMSDVVDDRPESGDTTNEVSVTAVPAIDSTVPEPEPVVEPVEGSDEVTARCVPAESESVEDAALVPVGGGDDLDLSFLDEVQKAPKGESGSSYFTSREIAELAAPYIVRQCLARKPITIGGVIAGVPEFAVYRTANAVGTAMQYGVKGSGLGLHGKAKVFFACRENATLAMKAVKVAGKLDAAFAAACGHASLAALAAAVMKLPSSKECK